MTVDAGGRIPSQLHEAVLRYFDGGRHDAKEWLGYPSAALGGATPFARQHDPDMKGVASSTATLHPTRQTVGATLVAASACRTKRRSLLNTSEGKPRPCEANLSWLPWSTLVR